MRLFYFAHSHDRPTGGQKQCYRHVDILNRHGFEAYALHMTPGFRVRWFENDTRTIDMDGFGALHDPARDFVVVPEDLGEQMLAFSGRKVIFNQNLFYGFHAFGDRLPRHHPYLRDDVAAVLTVSEHNAAALRFACPTLAVHRVVNGIDVARFAYRPPRDKQPLIACSAKAPAQTSAVYQIAQLRAKQRLSALSAFEWEFVTRRTEAEVAEILGRALVLVSLGVEEGLPLMPIEAMASGCLVLGPDAGPVTEYLDPAWRIPVGDTVGVVTRLEQVAAAYPDRLDDLEPVAERARVTAAGYSLASEEASVLAAWQAILAR